jgi:hypothetical protein
VPEIQEVRGVNAVSVQNAARQEVITTSGRKNVIGRPISTARPRILVHFGLKNLDELPSLEELRSWRVLPPCSLKRAWQKTRAGVPETQTKRQSSLFREEFSGSGAAIETFKEGKHQHPCPLKVRWKWRTAER